MKETNESLRALDLIPRFEWGRLGDSALRRRDKVEVLERTWEQLDRPYLKKWVTELGLQSEWDEAHMQAGHDPDREEA